MYILDDIMISLVGGNIEWKSIITWHLIEGGILKWQHQL